MATADHRANLGYFAAFMRAYGRASVSERLELYRDTRAYSGGAESAGQLYQQVSQLLGVPYPSPQMLP